MVYFLINVSIFIEIGCYLNCMNICYILLFCDFREVGNFKGLLSIIEFFDSICIFYENNRILFFVLNCFK